MGRRCEYNQPPPPTEPLRTLSESLLSARLTKSQTLIKISFDDRADATEAHKVLSALQASYTPPK